MKINELLKESPGYKDNYFDYYYVEDAGETGVVVSYEYGKGRAQTRRSPEEHEEINIYAVVTDDGRDITKVACANHQWLDEVEQAALEHQHTSMEDTRY
jgi:hypothetical protein